MIILCTLHPISNGSWLTHDYVEFCSSASRLKSGVRYKRFDGSCPVCHGTKASAAKTIDGGATWEILDSNPCKNCNSLESFISQFK